MSSPEQPNLNTPLSLTHAELQAALTEVQKQLAIVDANENQIERFFKRDELLELYDWLQTELSASDSPPQLR